MHLMNNKEADMIGSEHASEENRSCVVFIVITSDFYTRMGFHWDNLNRRVARSVLSFESLTLESS